MDLFNYGMMANGMKLDPFSFLFEGREGDEIRYGYKQRPAFSLFSVHHSPPTLEKDKGSYPMIMISSQGPHKI